MVFFNGDCLTNLITLYWMKDGNFGTVTEVINDFRRTFGITTEHKLVFIQSKFFKSASFNHYLAISARFFQSEVVKLAEAPSSSFATMNMIRTALKGPELEACVTRLFEVFPGT
jgi:hypothetical protein